MQKERGERRVFLPAFIGGLIQRGASVALEDGYGAPIGLTAEDYTRAAPGVRFVSHAEALQHPYVLVLRCPNDDELRQMRPGACLISMLHYPTRPKRVALLRSLGLEGISLDSLKDDSGRRLVENLRAVAWNGVEAAFHVLRQSFPAPGLEDPGRRPINVLLLGAGAVGSHVVQAAVRYGDDALRRRLIAAGVPGVRLNVVDYDLTGRTDLMRNWLAETDILIDATQRPDASRPVIPNDWVGWLPDHAVMLDLSVDPYDCASDPPQIKGIEGIPQGNLDQFTFAPDDPAFDRLPACVRTDHRRHAVSCYSWPGVHPQDCMEIYGRQITPIVRTVLERGGVAQVRPDGRFFERAIAGAQLSRWPD